MPFAVLPALIPDIRAVYDVYFAAFTADPDGRVLLDILFPDGVTSDEFRDAHTKGTLAWWHSSETQYTFKCVDMDTGEVIGMALCDVLVQPSNEGEGERKMPEVGWLEGKARERAERVLEGLWRAREKLWGGKSYIYIHAFAVNPKHQGRGAGAALVQALIDLGDGTGLPIYLESSPGSQGLYRKLGFLQVPGNILPTAVAGQASHEKGESIEQMYKEWYRRKDSGHWEMDRAQEVKTKAQ
ncbi:hypothetical protein VTI74DRAFT_10837 [Chaetomium olivicolor]